MVELLFLLLPLAFYSGWRAARKSIQKNRKKQKQLSSHFVKGVNFLLNEEPDQALEVFLNYPDIDEYTAETYQLLGNMFRNRGEVDRALQIHQNLIARSNLDPEKKQKAMFSLGKDFFAAGMLDRAESVFQELLSSTKSTPNISKAAICRSLRTIYEQTQEWQKAIDAINCSKKSNEKPFPSESINTDALTVHYYCELADSALAEGNLHEVDKLMAKAKSVYKESTRLMCLQGDVAYHQKNYNKALKRYLIAIKNDSRLLKMLSDKLEYCAQQTDAMPSLQNNLIKLYRNNKDKTVLEFILAGSKTYGSSDKIDNLIEKEFSTEKLSILSIFKASDYMLQQSSAIDEAKGLKLLNHSLGNYLRGVPAFQCEHCGYQMHDYLWRCPACHHWDTINHA